MRQLILDLLPDSPPSLDNFVAGGNAETVAALTGWLAGETADPSFCLYGESGCGRSHLLLASGFDYVDAGRDPALRAHADSLQLAVDNVDQLDDFAASRAGLQTLQLLFDAADAAGVPAERRLAGLQEQEVA